LLQQPTLVIVGSPDLPEIQYIVDTLTATVPHIQRVTFEGSGHMVNLEQPDRFTQLGRDVLHPVAGRP
jgi:pimeloyl-ACP methyl ester carboxylesterase